MGAHEKHVRFLCVRHTYKVQVSVGVCMSLSSVLASLFPRSGMLIICHGSAPLMVSYLLGKDKFEIPRDQVSLINTDDIFKTCQVLSFRRCLFRAEKPII
jgi:hypothetical protein